MSVTFEVTQGLQGFTTPNDTLTRILTSWTGLVITRPGLLQGAITVLSVPLGRGISTGSGSCLDSITTGQAAARPETPARKATIHT